MRAKVALIMLSAFCSVCFGAETDKQHFQQLNSKVIQLYSQGKYLQAAELAKLEKVMPVLLQIPGMKAEKLAEVVLANLDVNFKLTDFFDPLRPSIVAQNGNQQVSTGDPRTDPNAQGGNLPASVPGGNGALA